MHDPDINYRKHPEKYRIGPGETGVLTVEPYKSEILPYWTFKTPDDAEESSEKICDLFTDYLEEDDFVGADMARKFLRMGMTRETSGRKIPIRKSRNLQTSLGRSGKRLRRMKNICG